MPSEVNIIIVGNGFGGVYTLKNLHKAFGNAKNVKFCMVGERNYFLFTPLLHEVATGSLNPSNIIEPIRQVLGCYLTKFYLGKVESINPDSKELTVNGEKIPYDYLVLAPGSTTNFYNTPGAEKYSFSLKNIEDAVKIKNHCILQMEKASHEDDPALRQKMLRFVVVGGGPTGVELASELHELISESFSRYYKCEIMKDVSVLLIQRGTELVPQFDSSTRATALRVLNQKGVQVMLESAVKEVGEDFIVINDNPPLPTETVVWVAGVMPNVINFTAPVEKASDNKILVNEFLQTQNYPEIFALGDAAAFKDKKTGQYIPAFAQVAEKEAEIVAKNIYLSLNQKPLKEFVYRSSGYLISLGQWMAAGKILNFAISGRFTWWIWRTVYLIKFLSLRKKIRVAMDWTMNLFSPRDISEL